MLKALADLFSPEEVARRLPRLTQIHERTERIWDKYTARLRDGRVRYLLIAEAPPWAESDPPQYVLDPNSKPRTLMRALRTAFLGDQGSTLKIEAVLDHFAKEGLLVVDSLPFSMPYTSKLRRSSAYRKLVALSLSSYMYPKLERPSLHFDPDLEIAFSLELNARAIMEASKTLQIGGHGIPLSSELIGTGSNHYPDAAKLRALFRISGHT